jgi:hypothetical protein
MGASSSIVNLNEIDKKEFILNLKLTYEKHKDSSNDDLYNAYQQLLCNRNEVEVIEEVILESKEKSIEEVNKEKEQRILLNKDFIKYCGYIKGIYTFYALLFLFYFYLIILCR